MKQSLFFSSKFRKYIEFNLPNPGIEPRSPALQTDSLLWLRFLGWCKESTCQAGDCRFNSWVRKMPWRRKWQPNLVFLPGKSHGQRNLMGYSPWGCQRVTHDLVTKQQPSCFQYFLSPSSLPPKNLSIFTIPGFLNTFIPFSLLGLSLHCSISISTWQNLSILLGAAWMCKVFRFTHRGFLISSIFHSSLSLMLTINICSLLGWPKSSLGFSITSYGSQLVICNQLFATPWTAACQLMGKPKQFFWPV